MPSRVTLGQKTPDTTSTTSATTTSTTSTVTAPVRYKTPKFDVEIPDNLGRPPRSTDLIIRKGFDGLSPQEAAEKVAASLTNPLAPQNKSLVVETAVRAHRDFTVAINNVFIPGSPEARFAEQHADRGVSVLSCMGSDGVVYKVAAKGADPARYYTRNWAGGFSEMQKPPYQVVLEAKVRVSPPGIAVEYPKWSNTALGTWPLTTITEM